MNLRLHPLLLLPLISVGIARAADEPPPACTIDRARAADGRFDFRMERSPTDGRVAVPTGFPQVIRATLATAEGPRDLPVEISADAASVALLVPQDETGRGPIAVETADETRQFDDGRIVFTALDARVTGDRARLESQPGTARIGFWTQASDSVAWTRKATRWGMYDVRLTYSNASPPGTEIAVDVSGTTLSGTLASTGSWYRYATLPLGRVYLPTAGEQTVAVRCTKLVGGAVMNLKAVTLEPACEGTPPVQDDDGSITLHGRDATVLGTALRYEPAEKKQTLGYWTRSTDAATWTFTVRRPGAFDVEVLQGCGTGHGGSEMLVELDGGAAAAPAPLTFTVEDTGGFQAFKPRTIGRVQVSTPGTHRLRIAPQKIAKAAACDIRQVRLIPVAP